MNQEKDTLNCMLSERALEIEALKRQAENLKLMSSRVEQLTAQIGSLLDENRRLNDLATDRARENEALKRRVTDVERQLTRLTGERDTLNKLLSDRAIDVDNLRRQLEEANTFRTRVDTLNSRVNRA